MATMTPGTAFAVGAVGGALAGRALGHKKMLPTLAGAAAGSFALVQFTQPKMPPSGVYLTSAPAGQGLSTGTGALLVLGGIAVAVLYGGKILKKLGA
jgi:hypothetical protein